MERVALPLQPAGRPVAHEHIKILPSAIAGTVHAFVKMFVARVKMVRLGGESFGEVGGQIGFKETFGRVL